MRTGDVVRHIPSGEEWLVAWADSTELIACGWPETFAKVEDCELIEACSDDEHWTLVKAVAASRGSSRSIRCEHLLERRLAVECAEMMHL